MKKTINFTTEEDLTFFVDFLERATHEVFGRWYGREIEEKKELINSIKKQFEDEENI